MTLRKHPFIYWWQTENEVKIKVEVLLDTTKPHIKFKEKFISLEVNGTGSRGNCSCVYYFDLHLYENITTEYSQVHVASDGLCLMLKKQESNIWWPRLTAQPKKPSWIQIDKEHWITKGNDMDSNQGCRDIRVDYPGVVDHLQKEELGYRTIHPKTVYLIFYNVSQFVGYLYILIVLTITYQRNGYEEIAQNTYKIVGNAMKFCQLLQYLEVMHPLFGYTQGSTIFPFLQVTGRNFILFCMVDAETRIQTKPVILYLFLSWTLIECIRYPYYIMTLFKRDINFLTWLRYSIWIPLYPLGILCEEIIVLRNLPYFEETQKFSFSLPNEWNFTFSMCIFMKCYLLCLVFAGYILMTHMTKIRNKKINAVIINVKENNKAM